MNGQEKKLRGILRKKGYTLRRSGDGYRIGDQVTETVYLGADSGAALDEVVRFVDNLDESGYSSLAPYADGTEEAMDGEYIEGLHAEITNLQKHRETLLQQGKHAKAAGLDETLRELEEELADAESESELERKVRSFLGQHGYRLEHGSDGYRVSERATGAVCLGERYDAGLDDAAEFAVTLGFSMDT